VDPLRVPRLTVRTRQSQHDGRSGLLSTIPCHVLVLLRSKGGTCIRKKGSRWGHVEAKRSFRRFLFRSGRVVRLASGIQQRLTGLLPVNYSCKFV